MPEMLLINPRKRGSAKKRKTGRSAAQRRATAKLVAMNRARRGRSANPAPRKRRSAARKVYSTARRVARRVMRRRRNPISTGGLGRLSTYLTPIKDAAVMGAGAVAMDVAFGYINPMLPASMRKTPGVIGAGDAVKAVLTVALGQLLSGVTRGLSRKAAIGSLVVQARDIAVTFLPAGATVNGLGYVTSGRVLPGYTGRVNSNMVQRGGPGRVGMYTGGPGQTPLLNGVGAYTGGPGQSPLLSGTGFGQRRGRV